MTETAQADGGTAQHDEGRTRAVMAERAALTNLAYRLLGSLADAEDAVQETYARWSALSPEQRDAIRSPGGWLTTVVSRVCLDQLGSARARREQYVGAWLPEPVPSRSELGHAATTVSDPADHITMDESIDMAFLVMLDAMTPAERVAFLLHDVFRYPFTEVADIVGRTPGACRQLASSARQRVRRSRRASLPVHDRRAVVRDFKRAWETMDVAALIRLLDPSVTVVADGGGRVAASLTPIRGGAHVADYLVALADRAGGVDLRERSVNGQPGLVAVAGTATVAVYAFDVAAGRGEGRLRHMWVVRNPDKLSSWTRGMAGGAAVAGAIGA